MKQSHLIFDREEFAGHYDLAGWIYNIIETWITNIEVKIHNNEKTRFLTSFLKLCSEKALAWKNKESQANESTIKGINEIIQNSNNQSTLTLTEITNNFDRVNIEEVTNISIKVWLQRNI